MVCKRELIGNVDNIIFYSVSYDSANILRRMLLNLNIIERVCLIHKEAKNNPRRYLKTMGEGINLVLYIWVVIEGVVVEVAKL